METDFKSYGYAETVAFAKEFAKTLDHGDVIALSGDLGAGKTAFVQGLAQGLGIKEYITSPTFTIVNVYHGSSLTLYHFDAYRLSGADEMYEIGYEEYVYGDEVSVIEWPERIWDILPDKRYDIKILKNMEYGGDYREISVSKVGF